MPPDWINRPHGSAPVTTESLARVYVYDPSGDAAEVLAEMEHLGVTCEYINELDALEAILNQFSIEALLFVIRLDSLSHHHDLEYLTDLLGSDRVRVYPGGSETGLAGFRHSDLILDSVSAITLWSAERGRGSSAAVPSKTLASNQFRPVGSRRFSLVRRLVRRVRALTEENRALRQEALVLRRELTRRCNDSREEAARETTSTY